MGSGSKANEIIAMRDISEVIMKIRLGSKLPRIIELKRYEKI
jgi:hypothetical protein